VSRADGPDDLGDEGDIAKAVAHCCIGQRHLYSDSLFRLGSLGGALQTIRDKVIPGHKMDELSLKIGTEFK